MKIRKSEGLNNFIVTRFSIGKGRENWRKRKSLSAFTKQKGTNKHV